MSKSYPDPRKANRNLCSFIYIILFILFSEKGLEGGGGGGGGHLFEQGHLLGFDRVV